MKKSVSSKKYNADYFLKDCDGADFWQESFGAKLNPRLFYSWRLSGVKGGEKVLDFGCGWGEILVQTAKVKLGSWFQFTFLQPTWLPGVGKYFALDIWGKIS